MRRLIVPLFLVLLAAFATSCNRAVCPAYDGYSTQDYSKKSKGKKKTESGLFGKQGP